MKKNSRFFFVRVPSFKAQGSSRLVEKWVGILFLFWVTSLPIYWFHARPGAFRNILGGGGDGLFVYVLIDAIRRGQFPIDHHFGFPLGTNWGYFPNDDWGQLGFASLLDKIFGQGVGLPVLFIISFPITFLLARICFREVKVNAYYANLMAFSFTFLPWHFLRFGHILLSTSFGFVAGLLLAIRVYLSKKTGGRKNLCLNFGLILTCSLNSAYFAAFSLILLFAGSIWTFLRFGKSIKELFLLLIYPVAVLGVFAISQLPFHFALPTHAITSTVSGRSPIESEIYGGRLINLISPNPNTHIPGLSRALAKLNFLPVDSESGLPSNFGSFSTTIAFLIILFFILWAISSLGVKKVELNTNTTATSFFAFLLFCALAFFITYGPNLIFSALITPQIRAWNRMTPLLHLMFLLIAAVLSLKFLTKIASKISNPVHVLIFVALFAFIYVDQIPLAGSGRPQVDVGIARTSAARDYVSKLNGAIPGHCGVLELPYVPFPEHAPVVNLSDYELIFPALVDSQKGWSYGAMKTPPADVIQVRLDQLGKKSIPQMAAAAKKLGFCAIHLDRRGFSDKTVELALINTLGNPVVTGFSENWIAFKL